jgi:hypothetical protein
MWAQNIPTRRYHNAGKQLPWQAITSMRLPQARSTAMPALHITPISDKAVDQTVPRSQQSWKTHILDLQSIKTPDNLLLDRGPAIHPAAATKSMLAPIPPMQQLP